MLTPIPPTGEDDEDGLAGARALLPELDLEHVELLGGSPRSEVRRVRARAGRSVGANQTRTLIVKMFTDPGEGWVREASGLAVMPAQAPVPRLIAEGEAPPIVVLSDAGSGPSVADALLGADPVVAAGAVAAWAEAIGRLHCATLGARAEFGAQLSARAGDAPVPPSPLAAELDQAANIIERNCAELDVAVPAQAFAELRGLADRLNGDGPAALTPSDACPDNNVQLDDQLVLIDFEGAQWRHIAWDVAYLTVPWPSCWCAWQIPEDVAEQALDRYRATAASQLPYVSTAQFDADLTLASAGWAFLSTSWFLPQALSDDPPLSHPAMPPRQAMILHRLAAAAQVADLPALGELAARLHATLSTRWGTITLDHAPAFRSHLGRPRRR